MNNAKSPYYSQSPGNPMTVISFEIHYITRPGENLFIVGSIYELGSGKVEKAAQMNYFQGKWRLSVKLKKPVNFTYSYLVKDENGKLHPEAGTARNLLLGTYDSYCIYDQWRAFNDETPFLSNAFKNIFFKRAFDDNVAAEDNRFVADKRIEAGKSTVADKSPVADKNIVADTSIVGVATEENLVDDITIACSAYNLKDDQKVLISGNSTALANWSETEALPMKLHSDGIWRISFRKGEIAPFTEYKFILKKSIAISNNDIATGSHNIATGSHNIATGNHNIATGNHNIATGNHNIATGSHNIATGSQNEGNNDQYIWENGANRQIPEYPVNTTNNYIGGKIGKSAIIINNIINLPSARPRFAGTSIPVFSLRSKRSCGIGEFLDLIPFCDILAKTGQKILQILPVNDTTITNTWEDSYPYSAISIFALHPLYINLEEAGEIKDNRFNNIFAQEARQLNSLEEIDYEKVASLKWKYLKKLYEQNGAKTFHTRQFKEFFKHNSDWLKPYATFSYLRDRYKTADFSKWEDFSIGNDSVINTVTSQEGDSYKEIYFYYFVQYHLDRQLKIAHNYLNSKGIILKGDIPIGINRKSVETWHQPQYFNFNGQAGAPPDDFSARGQNWEFPTYNWDLMEKEGYEWWKRRLRKMSEYFDAFRIDHILGFFRIWEIPVNQEEGLMGYFNPSLPYTADEIISSGLDFNFDRFCRPFIREYILNAYYKDDKNEIISLFFEHCESGKYKFKDKISSQKEIKKILDTENKLRFSKYRDSLFSIMSEVLFIQDPYDKNRYHPRISAQHTHSFNNLREWEKDAFNKIYNHFYYTRHDEFWYDKAMKKLPCLISSTDMLVCGEDLGMLPSCLPAVMKSLSILSLEIERMPKNPSEKFGNTSDYLYLSVCTTGTHDTSTIRGWWEENRSLTQEYYNNILNECGEAPSHCEPWICCKIVKRHLDSPSMLTILPLQDWISMFPELRKENPHRERINVPSNPKHYWRYRMHIHIEKLSENENFLSQIKNMISESGR
ncbi:MAG: 4-alpha-glucanotransferase [Bacteroidales bacterium]|nr:4-alpha-glucanotransferase [Bacteroidales bacterium]MDD3988687.1 4-alpha-glucanotransferase [Bacteroidales bacterium]